MTQEWIESVGDADLPLEEAKRKYKEAKSDQQIAKAHKNVIRAERRLCAKYAPKYTEALLSGKRKLILQTSLKKTGELAAFEAARKRGE
jgi:hypothetical protein